MSSHLIFSVNNNQYAVSNDKVETTLAHPEIFHFPEMPLYFAGALKHSDGFFLQVLNLDMIFFGLVAPFSENSPIIIIRDKVPFGLLVADIHDTIELDISPSENIANISKKQYLENIGNSADRDIPIINTEYLSTFLFSQNQLISSNETKKEELCFHSDYLTFQLNDIDFAISVNFVNESIKCSLNQLHMKSNDGLVEGFMRKKNENIPIMNLGKYLKYADYITPETVNIIICHFNNMKFGITCDSINEIVAFDDNELTSDESKNNELCSIKHEQKIYFILNPKKIAKNII